MAWNGSGGSATPPKKAKVSGTGSSSLFRGIAALLLVLVIGGVAYLFVTQELPKVNESTEEKVEKKAIEVVEPEIAERAEDALLEDTAIEQDGIGLSTDVRKNLVCTTNDCGEITERWITPDGKKHARLIPAKPMFDNAVDQMLSIVLSVPAGVEIPPMPSLGQNAGDVFADALQNPIEINEDDSDQMKRAKLLVISGRDAMLEELRRGKRVEDVFADHCAMWNDNARLQQEVIKGYNDLIKEGDFESAELFRAQANELLEKAGADPIPERGTGARTMKGM